MSPLRNYITEEDLDFALRHITYFYDTDFFPRAEEFVAVAHSWDEIRTTILDAELDALFVAPPLTAPWPKTKSGYRIVHRPEPIDSIVYAALAHKIASAIEESRASPEIACSYRISPDDYSFFEDGSGFNVYRQRNENLAEEYDYVLTADISDFYNKIYLHRLQNGVQTAIDDPPGLSKRIEHFLNLLNTHASQGIPVGPAASIIMAEATLIDADQFVTNSGLDHARYVDDFQIFASSEAELQRFHQDFCLYLHENQRLSLSPLKTRIRKSKEFISEELDNQYQVEKLKILEEIEVVNPYSMDTDDLELEEIENAPEILVEALNKLLQYETLDLGVIRAIVRRARAHGITEIAPLLLENLSFFAPIANDLFLYLDRVSSEEFVAENLKLLQELHEDPANNFSAVRLWLEWFYARQEVLLNEKKVRAFVYASNSLRPQAQAAITTRNQSWVKDRKNQLLHYYAWQRRSVLLAARLLSKDEREKWLNQLFKANKLVGMDKWMAQWALDGNPPASPPEEEIPF